MNMTDPRVRHSPENSGDWPSDWHSRCGRCRRAGATVILLEAGAPAAGFHGERLNQMVLENVDQAAGLDVLLGHYAGERAADEHHHARGDGRAVLQ